jgi:hypothetical protein
MTLRNTDLHILIWYQDKQVLGGYIYQYFHMHVQTQDHSKPNSNSGGSDEGQKCTNPRCLTTWLNAFRMLVPNIFSVITASFPLYQRMLSVHKHHTEITK